jgi:hypothetical protein
MVGFSTVRISEELKQEVNQFEGGNFEERLKKWAGVSSPELTESRIREIVREELEEEKNRY